MWNPILYKTYLSPLFGRSNFLVVNKKNEKVYHAQLYEQFVSDMDSYVSKVSYLDTRAFDFGGVDFSYKRGEDETIYYLADGLFQVLDYKNGFTSFSSNASTKLARMQSTTDGVNLVAIKPGSTSEIFVFDIDKLTNLKLPNPLANGSNDSPGEGRLKSRWIR